MPLETLTIITYVSNPLYWFLALIKLQILDISGNIDHHLLS